MSAAQSQGVAGRHIGREGIGGDPLIEAEAELQVDDRVGQEVRNHLIFLLNGGAGQPANPTYRLTLATHSFHSKAASVQRSTEALEPTAEVVTVRTAYTLLEIGTGKTIARGVRTAQAPYDVSRQAFAAVRARRDAANRGAREVAEFLRLAVAQELERPSSVTAPRIVSAEQELEGFSETETDGRLPQ